MKFLCNSSISKKTSGGGGKVSSRPKPIFTKRKTKCNCLKALSKNVFLWEGNCHWVVFTVCLLIHTEKFLLLDQANNMCMVVCPFPLFCFNIFPLALFPWPRQQTLSSIVCLFVVFLQTKFNCTIQILQSTSICPFIPVYLAFGRFNYPYMNTKRPKLIARVIFNVKIVCR